MNNLNQNIDDNLVKKLLFYETYHSNFWNKVVHVIFVPLIFYTLLVMTSYISLYIPIFATFSYIIYYIYLDKYAGITYGLFLLFMLSHINSMSFNVALFIQILSWASQILSHKLIEKKAPALLDSFFQAITIAPLFTWYEVLGIFGYRKKLMAYVHNEALQIRRLENLKNNN